MVVLSQRGIRRPAMKFWNIVEFLFELIGRQVIDVEIATHIPELPEVTAALVGGILAPQQLARKFMVQPYHVGLNKLLIRLDKRDAVRGNEIDIWEEQFG